MQARQRVSDAHEFVDGVHVGSSVVEQRFETVDVSSVNAAVQGVDVRRRPVMRHGADVVRARSRGRRHVVALPVDRAVFVACRCGRSGSRAGPAKFTRLAHVSIAQCFDVRARLVTAEGVPGIPFCAAGHVEYGRPFALWAARDGDGLEERVELWNVRLATGFIHAVGAR